MADQNVSNSRRNFLKSGSILGLGSIVLGDPVLNYLAGSLKITPKALQTKSFSCELFRRLDLLHLKYFFYNAKVKGKYVMSDNEHPVFIYIQLPAQHIAEELVVDPDRIVSREGFRRKSFLGNKSQLAFKLIKGKRVKLSPEALLNWDDHFQLITLDDFAEIGTDSLCGYKESLKRISEEFAKPVPADMQTMHDNFARNSPVFMPLTKLELPYKMFLSPIGEPLQERNGDFTRQKGAHRFVYSNAVGLEYNNKKGLTIVRPWENKLMFQNDLNELSEPRLKVVTADCQRTEDNDCVELLPAPVHREELKNLTMLPAYDRDVISEVLKISSIGATTSLKYKNLDPRQYTTVAWEQKIKYGRDNYVAITFRAVDAFTGLKLLISIITDRDYKRGFSFLPKLYHVAYAEPEKVYTDAITVSQVPFTRIIPKTKGAYFIPQPILKPVEGGVRYNIQNAYAVAEKDAFNASGDPLCERLLTFDYLGIDKNGKEHFFQSKILYIPAENHEVTFGTYTYNLDEKPVVYSPAGTRLVDIRHIGLLNPQRNADRQGKPVLQPCSCDPAGDTYWYKVNKVFAATDEARKNLVNTLRDLKVHVNKNIDCYKFRIGAEVTYARLDLLKEKTPSLVDGRAVKESAITKDSGNASFNTRDMILFCQAPGEDTYASVPAGTDLMLGPHPVVAHMDFANVIVSQIDQMAGKSDFVTVRYADSYIAGHREIDIENSDNQVKLLFKLLTNLEDFFSKNYRSAGAMVNPGIDIRNISILEQSIAYNESHNAAGNSLVKQINGINAIKSTSIFGNLKAEILGIPLTDIVAEFLPVADLPVFNYLKQAEESVLKLQQIAEEYRQLASEWVADYNRVKSLVSGYAKELQDLDKKLERIAKNGVKAWLESLVEQSGVADLYNTADETLVKLKDSYKEYSDKVLKQVVGKIQAKYPNGNIDPQIRELLKSPGVDTAQALFKAAQSADPKFLSEVVMYYVMTSAEPWKIITAMVTVIELKDKLEDQYQTYFNALVSGYTNALAFVQEAVSKKKGEINAQLKIAERDLTESVLEVLGEDFKQKLDVVFKLHGIARMYTNYARFYEDLKQDYYAKLAGELNAVIDTESIAKLEAQLFDLLITNISNFPIGDVEVSRIKAFRTHFVTELQKLKDKNPLQQHKAHYEKLLKERVEVELRYYTSILTGIDETYLELTAAFRSTTALKKMAERQLQNFVQDKIDEARVEIEKKKKEMLAQVRGSEAFRQIQASILEVQTLIRKIEEISKQKLDYRYSTSQFRKASLGGVIDFVPNNTTLTVDVAYEIEFDVSQFDRLPTIKKQSFRTDSTITDFKIGLLQLLFIDFERVQFISGSEVKDDFRVTIRDVQFAGCLSFVQAFQEYLSNISDNLVFEIDSSGATVGYGFDIPDFSAGYFNFFNLTLNARLFLPFDPKSALQLAFGIGSEQNKFGLTVSGVFGGQGYFYILAEPRRGIVGMEICLEFGAIFNLDLVVAQGTAYLVGGIYIRKYNGKHQIRAYILCVGRLRIVSLFSASLSFYLALHDNGSELYGICIVTASKRFSRFFEISVRCTMRKTIKGAKSKKSDSSKIFTTNGESLARSANITVEDSNLLQKARFFNDEYAYVTLLLSDEKRLSANLNTPDGTSENIQVSISKNPGFEGTLALIRVKLAEYSTEGRYTLRVIKDGTELINHSFELYDARADLCASGKNDNEYVNSKDYYASYYFDND